jgi:DNA-binding response OmpR family regulator
MAKIVVMDDEPSARSVIKRILEKAGHEVLEFEDAAPALAEIDFATIDLAIIDLQMPTSGYDAIEEIRDRGHTDLPIIVVSAHVDLVLTPEMLNVQDIVQKPFSVTQLADAVEALL